MNEKNVPSKEAEKNGPNRRKRYSIALRPEVEAVLAELDRLPHSPTHLFEGKRDRWMGFVLGEAILAIAALGEKKGHLYWPMRLDVTGAGNTHWAEHLKCAEAIERELAKASATAEKKAGSE
ncbi:MAG: hypothetical protein Q8N18_06010 [Opitutaceae bacterium]|nr:hypothetical protein [Opitutaceae bacterium]